MDINVIKSKSNLYDLSIRDNKILEIYHVNKDKIDFLEMQLYYPKDNIVKEICRDIKKAGFIDIRVTYEANNLIYFATFDILDSDNIRVQLISYDFIDDISTVCGVFDLNKKVLTGDMIVKVFILSNDTFIIQTEIVKDYKSDILMGTIEFNQWLYSPDNSEPVKIVEENLKNNGINSIVCLNETDIMIKTGFSFLEDVRLKYNSENEALIESIYVTTLSKFIADIGLQLTNIDMELLHSVYFDRYILMPDVKDDYIFYNIVDFQNKSSECIFYNFVSKEFVTAKQPEVSLNDLRLSYVIDNTPYIRVNTQETVEFINMLTGENDISFYDEVFVDILGKLFITYKYYGKKPYLRIYNYPKMDCHFDEKYQYISGVYKDSTYYIYTV